MRKIVLTFGLISGAILSVMMMISMHFQDQIGFDRAMVVGYTTMVLAFLMIYFGIRSYRDNVAGGSVTFGRAFGVGMLIAVVATVCYVATWELVYYRLMPDFADKYAAHMVEKIRSSGASEARIASEVKEMSQFKKMYQNPLVNIAYTILEPMPVALVAALISAGLLSRKRRAVSPAIA